MGAIRDCFNRFLSANPQLNAYESIRQAVKGYRRGHTAGLVGVLVAGGASSLALSLLVSVVGYGNQGATLPASLAASVVSMMVSNLVFAVFLARVRKERLTGDAAGRFLRLIVTQIMCAVVLSFAQTLALQLVTELLAFNARTAVLAQLFVSTAFSMVNAVVAFRIYDGEKRFGRIFPGALKLLGCNWMPLTMLAVLFIGWSFVANVAYANLLSDNLSQVQAINNVFHALLNSRDYPLLGQVSLFYAVNYVVGGYFETYPLPGLAHLYEQDGGRSF